MTNRILVVYATRAGSTEEIADFVGKTLAKGGCRVDIYPVRSVKSLAGYTAVALGSGVRIGKLYPEIVDFAKRNQAALNGLPTACFVVCMLLKDNTPENRKTADTYAAPLRVELNPVDVGLFAGKMDYSRLGFFARLAVKQMVKTPEGDFRDWIAIEAWAASLLPKLAVNASANQRN